MLEGKAGWASCFHHPWDVEGEKEAVSKRRQETATTIEETQTVVAEQTKVKREGKGQFQQGAEAYIGRGCGAWESPQYKDQGQRGQSIYQALETGLHLAFPYKKQRLLGVIYSNMLYIEPNELKYWKIEKDRLG